MSEIDRDGYFTRLSDPIIHTLLFRLVQVIEITTKANGYPYCYSYMQYRIRFSVELHWHTLKYERASQGARDIKDMRGADVFTQTLLNSTDYESYINSTMGIFQWISTTVANLFTTARLRLGEMPPFEIRRDHPGIIALRALWNSAVQADPDFKGFLIQLVPSMTCRVQILRRFPRVTQRAAIQRLPPSDPSIPPAAPPLPKLSSNRLALPGPRGQNQIQPALLLLLPLPGSTRCSLASGARRGAGRRRQGGRPRCRGQAHLGSGHGLS